jgi:hypothetical protein
MENTGDPNRMWVEELTDHPLRLFLLHPFHKGAVRRVHANPLGIACGDTQGPPTQEPGDYFTRSIKVRSVVFTRIFCPASM